MATGVQSMQNADTDGAAALLSWEGDKMFHIYIHDYCNKRGYHKTARELVLEADIPQDSQPPINAKQGLLFEWWSVFWTLFTAKNNGQGPDEALLYTQHQANQAAIRQQNRNQPQQPNRMMNGMTRPPGAMPPNGSLPNGVGPAGMPGGQVGMPNGHMGFPMSNPVGHPPNGVPSGVPGGPPQQHNMPQMLQGQRPMGTGLPGQQNPPGMVQIGPGQHVAQMQHRTMPPPNGPHNMGNSMGPTQAHSPGFQQIGRPTSRPGTPGQNMMPNPSPSMANRQPMNSMQSMQMNDLNAELMRIPAALMSSLKAEAGLGDRDLPSFTPEEKQRVVQLHRQRSRSVKPPSQQGSSIAGPSSTPSMQPANLRNQQPQQGRTAAKRNSTSPGDEQDSMPRTEGSPPERKKMRPSPNGGEHPLPPGQSQQQPQQQPPMAPMAPFNHSGLGGPQNMGMRMGGPMGAFPHQQPGMHMSMNPNQPGMAGMPQMGGPGSVSPGMMNNPPPNMMTANANLTPQMQNYRQTMHNLHKNHIPPGALNTLLPGNVGSPQSNPQQQGGGPQFGPGPTNKPMGNNMMPPPPSPGMKHAQQAKDGNSDPNNRSENSPQTHNMGQPGGQNQGGQSQQQSGGPGTAPPTPVSNPGQGMTPDTSSSNLAGNGSQQQGVGAGDVGTAIFSPDLFRSMMQDDFDSAGFLRTDAGDLNFERDFGQWFNPDEMPLDLK